MRLVLIVAMVCTLGCSQGNHSKFADISEQADNASITLDNLVYADMYSPSYHTQHPLVCGTGRDFPEGRELAFKHIESSGSVHAVFPKGSTAPKHLNGTFVLKGHFQSIQNRSSYKFKKPGNDYRYFVVSSWEYKSEK